MIPEEPLITSTDLPPTFAGRAGSAWRLNEDELCQQAGVDPSLNNTWAWLVCAPGSHPFWYWYRMTMVDLGPRPWLHGDPIIHLEGATHEVHVVALDPEHYPPSAKTMPRKILLPINFAAQFIAEDNKAAIARVQESVLEIVNGTLSPDTDFMHQWVARYNDSLLLHKMKGM